MKLRRRRCFQFPHGGRKRKKKKPEETKTKNSYAALFLPLPRVSSTERLSIIFLAPSGHTFRPVFIRRVARKSDNPICGRRDFRPHETYVVGYIRGHVNTSAPGFYIVHVNEQSRYEFSSVCVQGLIIMTRCKILGSARRPADVSM